MSLLDSASRKSFWRGLDYYERNQVTSCKEVGDNEYNAFVLGGEKNPYFVHIDLNHPHKSECTCKFAEGRRVICKHMVALYFNVNPDEAKTYIKERDDEIQEYEERILEKENRREKAYQEIYDSLSCYSKEELQEKLARMMLYDRYESHDYDEYEEDIYEYYY